MTQWATEDHGLDLLRQLSHAGFLLHQVPDDHGTVPWALHYSRVWPQHYDGVLVHSDHQAWGYRSCTATLDPDQPWSTDPAAPIWCRGGHVHDVVRELLALPPRPPASPDWGRTPTIRFPAISASGHPPPGADRAPR